MKQKIQRFYVPGPVARRVAKEMGLDLPGETPVANIDEKELINRLFEKKAFRHERGKVQAERVNAKMVDLEHEASRVAVNALSRQARAQGLSSGLSIDVIEVGGIRSAETGMKYRSQVLKKASVLAEVDCAWYHLKRAAPVQVLVSIEEGEVQGLPDLPVPSEVSSLLPTKAAFFRRSWERVPGGEYLLLGETGDPDTYQKACEARDLVVVPIQHPEYPSAYEVLALTDFQIKAAEWEWERVAGRKRKCKTKGCKGVCKDGENLCPACLKQ